MEKIFWWFSNNWNEKKKNVASSRLGYCPFVVLSHDIVDCIVTHGAADAHGRPQYGRIGPRYGRELDLRHGRPARKGERCAREGLATGGVCHDTINCIVTGRRLGRWVVSRDRCNTVGGNAMIRRRS